MELQGLLNLLEQLEREVGPPSQEALDEMFDWVLARLYPTAPYRERAA